MHYSEKNLRPIATAYRCTPPQHRNSGTLLAHGRRLAASDLPPPGWRAQWSLSMMSGGRLPHCALSNGVFSFFLFRSAIGANYFWSVCMICFGFKKSTVCCSGHVAICYAAADTLTRHVADPKFTVFSLLSWQAFILWRIQIVKSRAYACAVRVQMTRCYNARR